MRHGLVLVAGLVAACSTPRAVDDTRRCATEAACATVHPPGIADPASADFHAGLVVATGWNLGGCAKCHGADFSGGIAEKTCLGCHKEGPTSCTTCHAQPPSTGAHLGHAQFGCEACHTKPLVWTDAGHLFAADGAVIKQATVTFGAVAHSDSATPTYDGIGCSGTYCHGATLHDPAARLTTPVWKGSPSDGACGSCHGIPPASHSNPRCSECHGRVVDVTGGLANRALHVDGQLSLGDDSGTCLACHPSPGGAHASHTGAAHHLARPLDCTECHAVPAAVDSPGHIDHDRAQVFPPGTSALARSNQANPVWDRAQGTCSDVSCHGGGSLLAMDTAPTIQRRPAWAAATGPSPAVCGACHGIPPKDQVHTATWTLSDCHRCHRTVDANGSLNIATHLNGIVDGP